MKIALSPTVAALALLSLLQSAHADVASVYGEQPPGTVVGSATFLGGGLYRYDYTITNLDQAAHATLGVFNVVVPHLYDHYVYYGGSSPYVYNGQPPHLDFSITDIKTSPNLPYFGYTPSPFLGTLNFGGGLTLGQSSQVSFVVPFPPVTTSSLVDVDEPDPKEGEGWIAEYAGTVIGPDLSGSATLASVPEPASGLLMGLGGLAWMSARLVVIRRRADRSAVQLPC